MHISANNVLNGLVTLQLNFRRYSLIEPWSAHRIHMENNKKKETKAGYSIMRNAQDETNWKHML